MAVRRVLAALLGGLLGGLLAACSGEPAPEAGRQEGAPGRIVSLDFCADQYVLRFAAREDILALSPDAARPFSFMRASAAGLPTVRPRTADILALAPDLVVRSYGGGPGVAGFLERAGVEVIEIASPATIADVRAEVVRVGSALGRPDEARLVARDMDRRLAKLAARPEQRRSVLYLTPGGVTAGPGTLVDELFSAAGLTNFQHRPGWNPIPLERLAYERPDLIAAASFEGAAGSLHHWSAARHPVAQERLGDLPMVTLDGAWTSCGGWFLIDAIEALASSGTRRAASPAPSGAGPRSPALSAGDAAMNAWHPWSRKRTHFGPDAR